MSNLMNVDSTDDRWARDKNLRVQVMSVGQGDCCLITCPNGEHIMIDCGSKGQEQEGPADLHAFLRSAEALGSAQSQPNTISALVLTHPDGDHYNQVATQLKGYSHIRSVNKGRVKLVKALEKEFKNLLQGVPTHSYKFSQSTKGDDFVLQAHFNPIKIREVYFGTPIHLIQDFASNYFANYKNLRTELEGPEHDIQGMHCVSLNDGKKRQDSWKPSSSNPFAKWVHSQKELKQPLTLASGDNPCRWDVSIIAGNVKEELDNSSAAQTNTASLVTRITIGKQKILICGDATVTTENYLLQAYKNNELKGIDLMQVPHHGSLSSSSKAFLAVAQPKKAVVSVKTREHSHHHPRKEVIDRYKQYVKTDKGADHPIACWQEVTAEQMDGYKTQWEADAQKGKIKFRKHLNKQYQITAYVLEAKEGFQDLAKYSGPIMLSFSRLSEKYVLMQEITDLDIYQTSEGHLTYLFDGK
jgi:beta-lactamase superfamily II metal-dependent hydrolase